MMEMTPERALLFALADDWMRDLLPPSVREALGADIDAARQVLESNPAHRDWRTSTRWVQHWEEVLSDPEQDPGVVESIQQALFSRRQLEIRYRRNGEEKKALIHPFGWTKRNNIHYLACTFRDYEDPRWLSVHRILSATPLDAEATPPLEPDAREAFLAHSPLAAASTPSIAIELEFPDQLHETISDRPLRGEDIQIDDPSEDGWFRVRGQVPDTWGLRWWLLGFNDQVRILRPEALKLELHPLLFDPVTGLANRHEFNLTLTRRLAETQRTHMPLSVVMLDLDYFREVNNHFGHPFGDQALRHVAAILTKGCREMDLGARYGGEEFALLLPNTTLVEAAGIAERLRSELEDHPLQLPPELVPTATGLRQTPPPGFHLRVEDEGLVLTASLGVAEERCLEESRSSTEEIGKRLVKRADKALYAAKEAGRNRVEYRGIEQ